MLLVSPTFSSLPLLFLSSHLMHPPMVLLFCLWALWIWKVLLAQTVNNVAQFQGWGKGDWENPNVILSLWKVRDKIHFQQNNTTEATESAEKSMGKIKEIPLSLYYFERGMISWKLCWKLNTDMHTYFMDIFSSSI